jgi:hypothetical protein
MDTLFSTSSTFSSLSLKDLIEARDLFHYHLINKRNVVATAIGLYRIRKTDPWPDHDAPAVPRKRKPKSRARTLFNSEVRPYSWPCIYAFVSDWQFEEKLAESDPSDIVPKSLYLPDGRTVPVCVIETRQQHVATDLHVPLGERAARTLLGPGVAIVNEEGQGLTRLATAGCIVRDTQSYYVLTNRHAVGVPGTPIKALQPNAMPTIGACAKKGLGREDFRSVYPNFASTNQRLLMDVGLVEVDDILRWKTQIPGIAPICPVLDLYDNSFTLKLITMKVVGQSAVTGRIRGEIHALFYRYKSLGGSEYLADFLIGPETYGLKEEKEARLAKSEEKSNTNVSLEVRHGDSGTLLFIEHRARDEGEDLRENVGRDGRADAGGRLTYYPFAILWGKEEFYSDGKAMAHPYALATSLSTALDRLDLDLVTDLNVDQPYVWGWVGHYIIGRSIALPADLVVASGLRNFIEANLNRLAINPDDALGNNPHAGTLEHPNFVALADVPDNVWKSNVNFTMVEGPDGKKKRRPGPGSRGQNDNPNHFADLDLVYKDDKTFLMLNLTDADTYLRPSQWVDYFAAMKPQFDAWARLLDPDKPRLSNHWGALPFRVHQLFDIMVAAARNGDQARFLAAGGVMIHYVGDACQPLHASYLSQGDPAQVVQRPRSPTMKLEADGVHSGYEDEMIAYGYTKKGLAAQLASRIAALASEPMRAIASGFDASRIVIDLIAATQQEIAPRAIVDKWVELRGTPDKDAAMWDTFGDDTITCMARGTRYLAALWSAAWQLGGGETTIGDGGVVDEGAIMTLYNDPDEMPSIALDRYPSDPDSDWSTIARNP